MAKLWKVVTVDGVEESREEFNKSTYKASPKIVKSELHPQTRMHPPQSEQHLQRGDEATIYATVAPYTAAASAVQPAEQPAEQPSAEEQAIIGDGQVDAGGTQ